METLPGELVSHLCSYLPRKDLKAFRLSCKAYDCIGVSSLFHDFEFRLWPTSHRIDQLEQLAASPNVAVRLRRIRFESGVQLEYADYRYWQAQLCHDISSNWSRARAVSGMLNDDYEEFHSKLQARFTPDMPQKYEWYRWHLDREAASVADSNTAVRLNGILNALHRHQPSLGFKFVMTEPRITLEQLEQFNVAQYQHEPPGDLDMCCRVQNRRRNCLGHFVNFLSATIFSDYEFRELVAVDLPDALLSCDVSDASGTLYHAFKISRKVDIKLSSFPHSERLSRAGMLDTRATNERYHRAIFLLKLLNDESLGPPGPQFHHLRLEFPEGEDAEYCRLLFRQPGYTMVPTPREWIRNLKFLSLSTFRCRCSYLIAFLGDFGNLESMVLTSGRLLTGSMIDLLLFMPRMQLRHVAIEGTWPCDEDLGTWHSHTPEDFNMCGAATTYEGPYTHTGMRSRIDRFMQKGDSCPLPKHADSGRVQDTWEAMGDTSWHYLPFPAHHS